MASKPRTASKRAIRRENRVLARQIINLLRLSGKPTRAAQYAIGNPLLAMQMIEHAPEVAFYAPLRLVVYENRAGQAVVAYERFTSQLAQNANPEIAPVAQLVEQKLEALVFQATGAGQETHANIGADFRCHPGTTPKETRKRI